VADEVREVHWVGDAEKLVDPESDDWARGGSAGRRMSEPGVRKTLAAADELRAAEPCTRDAGRSAGRPCGAAEAAEALGAEAELRMLSAAPREEQRAVAGQLLLALIQPAAQDAMARAAEPQSTPGAEQRRQTDSRAQAEQQAAESRRAQRTELLPEVAERQAAQAALALGLPASSAQGDAEAQQGAGAWPQARSGD